MSFTYPLLLGGLLAVVIPVALHLLLRQKPKVVLFPAFRFLVQRSRTNLTKLRLRHFLLLALRVLLFALIVLALAQPKVRDNPWNLSSDQAVAAVFVFDTSASMDYTVGTSQTRLKEAQKRAVEMLQLLPANSEVVVLDTADAAPVGKSDWLSRETAAERIGQLKVQPANAPVTARLAVALRLFAKVAETRDEDERYKRARVLVVFSDRTRAAWDTQERRNLQTLANQVPPALERLAAVRGGVPELVKLLGESGQDEQPLIDRLQKLADLIPQLRPETYPDAETTALIGAIRSRQQELAALLQKQSTQSGSDKLLAALKASLRGTGGFTGFYVDVGVEQPHDTALLDFQLVRQFKDNALVHRLQVDVQQTGDDSEPGLVCEVDGAALPAPVELDDSGKPRKARTLVFDLAPEHLARGLHQAKVSLKTPDALANNNTRYLTYAVRPVLLLTDDPDGDEAKSWERAIQANQLGAALYRCDRKRPGDFEERGAGVFNEYAAVFLCGVKEPRPKLWELLKDHAESGRGLGVFPPVGESDAAAYNEPRDAQAVLPASLDKIVSSAGGAAWNFDTALGKHAFTQPFRDWKEGDFDIIRDRCKAWVYWQVQPRPGAQVLVSYDNKQPALLERVVDRRRGKPGRVLLFTTPPGNAAWNDYLKPGHSFYVTLARLSVGYLTGDLDRPALTFVCRQPGPLVPVLPAPQLTAYKLFREGAGPGAAFVGMVTAEASFNEARAAQAVEAGNYTLKLGEPGDTVARFSLNVPGEESDLARTPREEVELVLGPDAVLHVGTETKLSEAMQGYISRPWELFPVLMLVVLVFLAVENLLANKFYRREPEVAA